MELGSSRYRRIHEIYDSFTVLAACCHITVLVLFALPSRMVAMLSYSTDEKKSSYHLDPVVVESHGPVVGCRPIPRSASFHGLHGRNRIDAGCWSVIAAGIRRNACRNDWDETGTASPACGLC